MGMSISEYATEELEEELNKRREIQREKDRASCKPAVVEHPDYGDLKYECDLALENIIQNGGGIHERQQYVYVDAMRAIYGEYVFDWMRRKAT